MLTTIDEISFIPSALNENKNPDWIVKLEGGGDDSSSWIHHPSISCRWFPPSLVSIPTPPPPQRGKSAQDSSLRGLMVLRVLPIDPLRSKCYANIPIASVRNKTGTS